MHVIADLQLHSRFSRAVSKEMTLPNMAAWAKRKGIGLLATGDWTHPMWFREIERDLEEMGNGLLKLKSDPSGPPFLLASEVSSIYTQNGKGRRVHTLIWVPSIASARKISQEMTKRGCNLLSDGRPIIPLSTIHVAELVFSVEPKALVFPAHVWTPWFSTYGSMSGFQSIEEAYGEFAKHVYAVETGLSSNPAMNWQIKELDSRSIVSFSDAHSGPKMGREATVFDLTELSYDTVYRAISGGFRDDKIAYTIEFYPEEGKYHFSGHRSCNIRWGPADTKKNGTTCPVCGKGLTQGVVQRVEELSGRSEGDLRLTVTQSPLIEKGPNIAMTKSNAFPDRPPFTMLVPLQEIISECIGSPVVGRKTQTQYQVLTEHFGSEFAVLLHSSKENIAAVAGEKIAMGIEKVRTGDIVVDPGYDGVFGVVKIWQDGEAEGLVDKSKEQLGLF
jgi:PHP family Zn ribbon phosphoesterase